MKQGGVTSAVSDDGKTLTCFSENGQVKWKRGGPSIIEWERVTGERSDLDLENGVFQYSEKEMRGVIYAVFTPRCGLDFNLSFAANSGELLRIHEAR